MISKDQLLKACLREIGVIKHLATKVPIGGLDYRPTPAQRSTLELMQYLTICAISPARGAITNSWDHNEELGARAEKVTPDRFNRAMDQQAKELRELFQGISSQDFSVKTAMLPWGEEAPLGAAMMQMTLSPLVAYRMQFFLYCKAAGASEINSANCWVGVDMPAEAEA